MRHAALLAIAIAFAIANAVAAPRSVNYCGAKMCGHTNAHTFCQYPAGPSPRCRGYMDAHLSMEEKVRIVARLNRRRSEAASGRLRRLPAAGDMLKLRWIEELAREAQRWADQCRPPRTPDERDACRDLYSTSVGMCVASVVGEAPGLRVESMVDMWYMQSILYRGNVTSYIVPMSNVSFYGDFAQMVWARSYMVGCGRSRFMSEWQGRLRSVERLVCNFAPRGPVQSRPLWTPAAPAKACPPRSMVDPDLPALCTFQHHLDASTDVEGAMTLEEHILLSIILDIEKNKQLNYFGSLDELYLTRLAVVTMDTKVTTPTYDIPFVHKRDIIETLGLDENVVHIDNTIEENNPHVFINMTKTIMAKEETLKKVSKPAKKAVLIGRPKAYNIEELNEVQVYTLPEDTNPHEDIPSPDHSKIDRDVYLEYALLDVDVDNVSSVAEIMTVVNVSVENATHRQENTSSIDESNMMSSPSENVTPQISTGNVEVSLAADPTEITTRRTAITYDYFMNATARMNVTTPTVSYAPDEDYLTDPETVREIQEALERMERSLEEAKTAPVKVRRELRDHAPMTMRTEPERRYARPPNQNAVPVENKTIDRGPMLNMVLKYMPILKPYENEILGNSPSSARTSYISYFLFTVEFMLVCL